jgi:hypothetical protein
MNYKESIAVATECSVSHEEATEIVNELVNISPVELKNKIQERVGANIDSVFSNNIKGLNSINYVEDTLTNMSSVFNIRVNNKFAGISKSENKLFKLDFNNDNFKNKNISRKDYDRILKDPIKNKVFFKPKEFDNIDPMEKPPSLRKVKNIRKSKWYSVVRAPSFVDNTEREIQSVLIDIRKVNALWENNVHNLVAS